MSYTVTQAVEKLEELYDRINGIDEYWIRDNIKEVITDLTNPDMILIEWSIDDVYAKAEEEDKHIEKEDALRLLTDMEHRHDASAGINWDVISAYLDNPDYNAVSIEDEED